VQPFLFLDEAETASLITMQEAVATCEAVLREQGEGTALLSDPAAMFVEGDPAAPVKFKIKGGALRGLDVCGLRIVGDIGKDGCIGEHHYCLLLDPVTAIPRGLIAQTELHRIRTAACALAALRKLAASSTRTVAIIGAGKIGALFAKGFHDVFPDMRLIVSSRRIEPAQAVAEQVRASGHAADAMSIADAAAQADAIVAITTATEPVIDASALRPGVTIIGMGEYHELPVSLLHAADRFIVDDFGFASMLGSLSYWISTGGVSREAAQARVAATLSLAIAGKASGRTSDSEKIVAIVQGLAIADLALADLCRRRSLGVGD
jgi:ornithine cyclodeaminase/alanine dehydrogenase-like protein (mu-crystallin family)